MIFTMMENKVTENNITGHDTPNNPAGKKKIVLPPPQWGIAHIIMVLLAATALSMLPFIFYDSAGSQVGINMLSGLLQDGAFFLLPCALVFGLYKQPSAMLGMFRVPLIKVVIIGIFAGVLFYFANTLTALLVELIFPGKIASSQSSMALFQMAENSFDLVLLIIFFCVVAPAAEEMMFRAFTYPPLLMRFGRSAAVIISAALFAAMHLNIWTFLPLFVGGLGFSLLYDKFRNLWINICAHMAWNTLVVILYFA